MGRVIVTNWFFSLKYKLKKVELTLKTIQFLKLVLKYWYGVGKLFNMLSQIIVFNLCLYLICINKPSPDVTNKKFHLLVLIL